MFRAEELRDRLRRQPFQPFRVIASEGLRYDIVHPDLVMIGERDIAIGIGSPHHPEIYSRLIRLALVHVVGIEDLPMPIPTTTNGKQHPSG
jgi:hypothetical protein